MELKTEVGTARMAWLNPVPKQCEKLLRNLLGYRTRSRSAPESAGSWCIQNAGENVRLLGRNLVLRGEREGEIRLFRVRHVGTSVSSILQRSAFLGNCYSEIGLPDPGALFTKSDLVRLTS